MPTGRRLSPDVPASALRSLVVMDSTRVLTVTQLKRIGIENFLELVEETPMTITKRNRPLATVYSSADLHAINTGVADFNAAALRALAEMVGRLSERELWSLLSQIGGLLGVSVQEPESDR